MEADEQPNDGYDLTQPYPGSASGLIHPALVQAVRDQPTPGDQEWGGMAAQHIQRFLTARALNQQSEAERNAFITNLDRTKNNLVGMVKADPNATALAMDLAGPAAYRFVEHHPDDAQRDEMHDSITSHLRQEIARASVQSHADLSHADGLRALDALKGHLADGDETVLRQYTDNMETVRGADAAAAGNMRLRQLVEGSNAGTMQHFSQLMDPETGAVQFPAGWGRRMMQDHTLAPEARQGLFTAYQRLTQNGDATSSNPSVVHDLLSRAVDPYHSPSHPMPSEVIAHAGDGLTMADAQFISSQLGRQSPQQRDTTQRLVEALDTAQDAIGNNRAFGRFTNWFLPAFQRMTNLGVAPLDLLHPESTSYMLSPEKLAGFMPNGDDVVAPAIRSGPRPSLASFFGLLGGTPEDTADPGPEGPRFRGVNAEPPQSGDYAIAKPPAEDNRDTLVNQPPVGVRDDNTTSPNTFITNRQDRGDNPERDM